jgi:hypothetical protein
MTDEPISKTVSKIPYYAQLYLKSDVIVFTADFYFLFLFLLVVAAVVGLISGGLP